MPFIERKATNVLQVMVSIKSDIEGVSDSIKTITLKPGLNVVTDTQYKLLKTNAGFNRGIDSGMLEVKEDIKPTKEGGKDLSGVEALKGKTIAEAKKLIGQILNIEDLEKIMKEIKKPGIVKACEKQIEKLRDMNTDNKDQ